MKVKCASNSRDVCVESDRRAAYERFRVRVDIADTVDELLNTLLGVSVDCQTRHVAVH